MLDAHLTLTAQRTRLDHDVVEDDQGDQLVQDVADLDGAAHVADRHVIAVDHAGPLEARGRLDHDS